MARTMKVLSGAQQLVVNEVREATAQYERAKLELEAELRKKMEDELAKLQLAQAISVRRAVELGVPKTRITAEGLGKRNPHIVYDLLRITERLERAGDVARQGFSWHDKAAGVVRVRIEGFPTRSTAPDYPSVLDGLIDVSAEPWTVVHDESDAETELGTIPGFLRWEMEDAQSHIGDEASLTSMLARWLVEHAE